MAGPLEALLTLASDLSPGLHRLGDATLREPPVLVAGRLVWTPFAPADPSFAGVQMEIEHSTSGEDGLWLGSRRPFTPAALLEHMRIAQEDILHYGLGQNYRERPFPDGYWPRRPTPPNDRAWARSVAAFRADLGRLRTVVRDRTVDLLAPIPHCGVSWFHELCIVANHNSYHAGQLVQLRKSLQQQRP